MLGSSPGDKTVSKKSCFSRASIHGNDAWDHGPHRHLGWNTLQISDGPQTCLVVLGNMCNRSREGGRWKHHDRSCIHPACDIDRYQVSYRICVYGVSGTRIWLGTFFSSSKRGGHAALTDASPQLCMYRCNLLTSCEGSLR